MMILLPLLFISLLIVIGVASHFVEVYWDEKVLSHRIRRVKPDPDEFLMKAAEKELEKRREEAFTKALMYNAER